jgi:hypothetical protein
VSLHALGVPQLAAQGTAEEFVDAINRLPAFAAKPPAARELSAKGAFFDAARALRVTPEEAAGLALAAFKRMPAQAAASLRDRGAFTSAAAIVRLAQSEQRRA